MTKKAQKTIAKKQLKMKIMAEAPVAISNVPPPQGSPGAKEGGPMDISTMDHASGLSGMPTQASQK